MTWRFLEHVLNGASKYSTVIGRVWLSVLFVFRILVYVTAAEQVWKDETKDFTCNTEQPGCENVCFDHFFPISQVRLWAIQLIVVSTPSLLVALHVGYRKHREARFGKKLYDDKSKINGGLLATYLVSIIFKIAFEVGSLVVFYMLYNGFSVPRLLQCSEDPCPNTVNCYISRPTEKTVFLYIIGCASIICICLNITEMLYIIFKQCWKYFSQHYVPIQEKGRCHCDNCKAQVSLGQESQLIVELKQEGPSS